MTKPAPDSIRVATWNCFGAPVSADDFFAGRPFWPERLVAPAVVETLARFDLVCIQENLVERVRESLERLRDAAGFRDLWFDPMGPDNDDGTFVGGGLAILSKWPVRARFVRLPRGEGPDGFARKGLAIAEIALPSGREIHVINTHLQADDSNVSPEACRRARGAQLHALTEAIAPVRELGGPIIVCGDLNVAHGTEEYEEVRALFTAATSRHAPLLDLTGSAGLCTYDVGKNDLAATFHGGGPTSALFDYIWATAAFVARDVTIILDEPLVDLGAAPAPHAGRAFPSDHFGVGATLELT